METNNVAVNGKFYELFTEDEKMYNRETSTESRTLISSAIEEKTVAEGHDKTTMKLAILKESAALIIKCCDEFDNTYRTDDNARPLIEKSFKLDLDEYLDSHGIIQNARNHIDDRNKWFDFEKIMMQFLMETGETISHIAKLTGYSSKFASIGVKRNDELEQFKQFLQSCPLCKGNIEFAMNEDIQRYKSGRNPRFVPNGLIEIS